LENEIMAKSTKGATAATLTKYLDLSYRRIQQLLKEGVLPRRSDGDFNLIPCCVAYVRYLRDEGRRVTKSAAASRTQELRAQEIELRLAREKGKLIEFADVELVIAEIVGTLHSELIGLPASCTRDLTLRNTIEEKTNDAIGRCRRRFEEASEALCTGREVFTDEEEADA
jgi:phage terminase Nu1 subunit (DNA packaging protein)